MTCYSIVVSSQIFSLFCSFFGEVRKTQIAFDIIWPLDKNKKKELFLGIQFQHSSSGKADGYNYGQQSALRVNQANDVKISNCEFSHIGMTGLFFANSNRHSICISGQ